MAATYTLRTAESELPRPSSRTPARNRRSATEWRLMRLARLLDARFRIPGTSIRFGWDSLVGLIPGIGDTLMMFLSLYIIINARRAGASGITLMKMLGNVGLEFILGTVPILGDVFDVAWKANLRNVKLLEAELKDRY